MNTLIFTDPHLTDSKLEEYRWAIFEILIDLAIKHDVGEIHCLGDLVDRKDRHTGALVNRLVDSFSWLQVKTGALLKILSGNHDKPLEGPYYWQFLDKLGIPYIIKPEIHRGIYLLPFSANPAEEWKNFDFASAKALFMHQTGQGVTVEDGYALTSNNLPKFPDVPIYSGDVHRPQEVEGITYVGTPHPVKFSETWDNRVMLIKNDAFAHPQSIWLPSIKRAILTISNSKELNTLSFRKGDQVRVHYILTGETLVSWPEEQRAIRSWVEEREIHIASLDASIKGAGVQVETNSEALAMELMKPEEIVLQFGSDEKLSKAVIDIGIELVKSV